MKKRFSFRLALLRLRIFFPLAILSISASAQKTVVVDSSERYYRTVIAGKEYERSKWHESLWGEDYRKEWSTPVRVPLLNLDSAYGGLSVLKEGGGRQTKSLHLVDAQGKRWVLRTVDKTYTGALPEIVKGSFVEDLANDQTATLHPYAALTIPSMAEASGVYHTNPKYYVVLSSPRLGEYNETFANSLCMLEEHPDETQTGAPGFGRPEDIVSTEKMLEKVTEENDHLMDQNKYVKTRLFDMFIGDWGRHPDNWRWAKFDKGSDKVYQPVPKDRDQTYAKFEGFFLSLIIRGAGLKELQTFDDKIHNIKWYNSPPSPLDRRFANELTRQVWIDSAKALQGYLTDAVIENAVKQLPPEIYALSAEEMIRNLKSRRNDLVEYANEYYDFLSGEVDIAGSEENEIFEVRPLTDSETLVTIYPVKKNGEAKKDPIYSRTFISHETHEIRLYGIGGNDVFKLTGRTPIKIRVIGGDGKDSVISEGKKIIYYDSHGNSTSGKIESHMSSDSSVHDYPMEKFKMDKQGFIIMPNYSNTRGIFFEVGYKKTKQHWRKEPFAWQQSIKLNYSVSNKSFGGDYHGIFNELIGKWSLLLNASYDQVLKNYFFGLGNETPNVKDIGYYGLHTEEGVGSIGLNRVFNKYHSITLSGLYQSIKVKGETDHLTYETLPLNDPTVFNRKNFAGGQLTYAYYRVNDDVVPTKGFGISLNGSHMENLTQSGKSFNRYWTTMGFYIPLGKTFSIASRNGLATVNGEPEFYQYNWLGGGQNLRGYHRQRFYGNTSFFNNNELRWIPNIRSYLFNGKIGLIGFVDDGRVWLKNDNSSKWHVGYGGGLLLAPFNKISATIYYGVSEDDALIHIRLGRFF